MKKLPERSPQFCELLASVVLLVDSYPYPHTNNPGKTCNYYIDIEGDRCVGVSLILRQDSLAFKWAIVPTSGYNYRIQWFSVETFIREFELAGVGNMRKFLQELIFEDSMYPNMCKYIPELVTRKNETTL